MRAGVVVSGDPEPATSEGVREIDERCFFVLAEDGFGGTLDVDCGERML